MTNPNDASVTSTDDSCEETLAKAKIIELLQDNEWAYHSLPHTGLVNDWFIAYVELSRAVLNYFGSSYVDSYELPSKSDIGSTPIGST